MAREPFSTLSDVCVGDAVDVMDRRGHWYASEVVEIYDYVDCRTIKVSYDGWGKKYDEWIGDPQWVCSRRETHETAIETAQMVYADAGAPTGMIGED